MKKTALVFASLLTGCAGTSRFVSLDRLEHVDPAKYPEDDAVVLELDETQYVERQAHRLHHYERVAVLKPSGVRLAHFSIPLLDSSQLSMLHARSIGPRGDVHALVAKPVVDGKTAQFDVPGVEVGSVVEVEYERERTGRIALIREVQLSRNEPIAHERYTLRVQSPTRVEAQLYNSSAHIRSNGSSIDSVTLDDVPADRHETFAPPTRLSQPRLAFRLVSQLGRAARSSWADLLVPAARQLYPATPRHLPESAALAHGAIAPHDKRAFLDEVVAWLASSTDLLSIGFLESVRDLGVALASHHASSTERAVLLKAQLDRAHVTSHFAVVADPPGTLDPTFPAPSAFGHVVVSVPAQLGLDAPVVIDPTCMGCSVGELPPWTARSAALPIDLIAFWPENGNLETQVHRFAPSRVPPSTMTHRWVLALDETGDAVLDVVIEHSDEHAAREGWQVRDAKTGRDHTLSVVKRMRGVAVDSIVPTSYDPRANVLRTEVHGHSRMAARTGDRISLLLGVMRSTPPMVPTRTRLSPVYFPNDATWTDELSVKAPPGWAIESLPAPRRHEAPGYVASVEVEPTADGAIVRSKVEMRAGDYPPAAYAAIVAAAHDAQSVAGESIFFKKR